jgi:dTDP-4-dehydrorhamnose reductase
MTILVTGARGTVGRYFAALADTFTEPVELAGREELDITDLESVRRVISRRRPDRIVNLAAATDLDRAEKEPEWAWRLNALGPWNLALASAELGAELVQVSTIGLFGADAPGPFTELDLPAPCNVYARTKLAGEDAVRAHAPRHYVVRTAWVMGGGRKDKKFVGQLLERMERGEKVRAVDDKVGSPTYARDLVVLIRELIKTRAYGLYHATNAGAASRYDIAVELNRLLGGKSEVERASSAEFPRPAPRPRSEVSQSLAVVARGLDAHLGPWQDALARYLAELR